MVDGEPGDTHPEKFNSLTPELRPHSAPRRRPPPVLAKHGVEARRLLTRALVRWSLLLVSRADLSKHQNRNDFGVDPLLRAAARLREAQLYAEGGRRPPVGDGNRGSCGADALSDAADAG